MLPELVVLQGVLSPLPQRRYLASDILMTLIGG